MRRWKRGEEFNFWPCVSDLMLGAFMLALLMWICTQAQLMVLAKPDPIAAPPEEVVSVPEPEPVLPDYPSIIEDLKTQLATAKEKPSVIDLPEAKGFRFESKKCVVDEDFATALHTKIVPKLQEELAKYRKTVDTIEIIGHTDSRGIFSAGGYLDRDLNEYLAGSRALDTVHMGSNADLGLLRALAVAEELKKDQLAGRLEKLPIRVYSAGSLISPPAAKGVAPSDDDCRRIEIRLSQPDGPAPRP